MPNLTELIITHGEELQVIKINEGGYSGFSGFSGSGGSGGTSGFSGYSGFSSQSGFSGFSGYSANSGYSGFSAASGASGYSGFSGYSGYSGKSGFSGYCGTSGYSGFSGIGTSGFSGYSGRSGYSGFSAASPGASGYSGFSGKSGYSGFCGTGTSGYSGFSGVSGYSGFSGSGISGYSGFCGTGTSGFSGYSGFCGLSGYSGFCGLSGYSGFCGQSGYSGFCGTGTSGFSGFSGVGDTVRAVRVYNSGNQSITSGAETVLTFDTENYDTDTMHSTSSNTGRLTATTAGKYVIQGECQLDASALGTERRLRIRLNGTTFIAQESQLAFLAGTASKLGIQTAWNMAATDYVEIMVFQDSTGALNAVGGQDTTWFAMSRQADLGVSGASGYSGYSGLSGYSGFCGLSGYSGFCGLSGYSGFSSISGYSGFSGSGGGGGTTSQVSGSNFTTTSSSVVDITGLTFAASASKLYEVNVLLKVQSTTASGLYVGLNYSAAGATGQFSVIGGTSASAAALAGKDIGAAPVTAYATTANTDRTIVIFAAITIGANAGNITVTMGKDASGGGTATCYIGSRMTVTLLA